MKPGTFRVKDLSSKQLCLGHYSESGRPSMLCVVRRKESSVPIEVKVDAHDPMSCSICLFKSICPEF